MPAQSPLNLAAVDLGSNSFHMVLAVETPEGFKLLDRLREGVRLAEGITAEGGLRAEVEARALACLGRFGQRLRGLNRERVRVVGTNTLRVAGQARDFLAAAEKALGFPIEIISGREEGRLIYLGVAHSLGLKPDAKRLVVDIGGGSTEVMVGQGSLPLEVESFHLGCVSSSRQFFPDAQISPSSLQALEDQVRVTVEPFLPQLRSPGWDEAVGASGTVRAIQRVLEANDFGPVITRPGMDWLRARLLALKRFERFADLKGLKPDRIPVLAGGFAILNALMSLLALHDMAAADGALREGVLLDLIGRIHHEDARESSIRQLQTRFRANASRAETVIRTARGFFEDVQAAWKLKGNHWDWLRWAIMTHDIGLDIAHSGYHRHGEYILRHADLPGFSKREQDILARLVRLQRKLMPALDGEAFAGLPAPEALTLQRLAVLLRLSLLFHRGQLALPAQARLLAKGKRQILLILPENWLVHLPLLEADLAEERTLLHPHFQLRWQASVSPDELSS
ncbi:Ppx/GppA phosphatase family protein [Thermithiobacillus plumbiphilus]|uniref:Ppx/GppA phosphatase family protein n=1 Tax=Thermithiobacillus plumbiphilus TaxID=1729899 RepID=A0ABU9D4W2_9PROT